MDSASTAIESGTELRTRAVVEFTGIDKIKEILSRLHGQNSLRHDISERWRVELEGGGSNISRLFLNLAPIPTSHEFYILGNFCTRSCNVTAKIRRKTMRDGRGDDILGHRKVLLRNSFVTDNIVEIECGSRTWKWISSQSEIWENEDVVGDDSFVLDIEIEAPNITPLPVAAFTMASHLQDPSTGDVVILLSEESDGSQDRRIYACKPILAAASEFFACRFKPVWTTKTTPQSDNSSISMKPDFNETWTAKTIDSRLVVYFNTEDDDIDFVTLHNLIYWMYTNSVNLRDRGLCPFPANDTALVAGHPAEADAFDLYRNAKKLLLEPLQDYCFDYLKRTTRYFNIINRLFRPDAALQHHDLLREW